MDEASARKAIETGAARVRSRFVDVLAPGDEVRIVGGAPFFDRVELGAIESDPPSLASLLRPNSDGDRR